MDFPVGPTQTYRPVGGSLSSYRAPSWPQNRKNAKNDDNWVPVALILGAIFLESQGVLSKWLSGLFSSGSRTGKKKLSQGKPPPSKPGQVVTQTIIVDRGHGYNNDPGGFRNYRNLDDGRVDERDINVPVAAEYIKALKALDAANPHIRFNIIETDDMNMDKDARKEFKKLHEGALFVSLHANTTSDTRTTVSGIETIAETTNGVAWGRKVHQALSAVGARYGMGQRRFINTDKRVLNPVDFNNDGVVSADEELKDRSIMVELGFINNYSDAKTMLSHRFQRDIGWELGVETLEEALRINGLPLQPPT